MPKKKEEEIKEEEVEEEEPEFAEEEETIPPAPEVPEQTGEAYTKDEEEQLLRARLKELEKEKAIEDFQRNAPALIDGLTLRIAELEKVVQENRSGLIKLRDQLDLLIKGK